MKKWIISYFYDDKKHTQKTAIEPIITRKEMKIIICNELLSNVRRFNELGL